jgi:hypothetical protein
MSALVAKGDDNVIEIPQEENLRRSIPQSNNFGSDGADEPARGQRAEGDDPPADPAGWQMFERTYQLGQVRHRMDAHHEAGIAAALAALDDGSGGGNALNSRNFRYLHVDAARDLWENDVWAAGHATYRTATVTVGIIRDPDAPKRPAPGLFHVSGQVHDDACAGICASGGVVIGPRAVIEAARRRRGADAAPTSGQHGAEGPADAAR